MKQPIYHTLQLTRVDNTDYTYDVECNWRSASPAKWVWMARLVINNYNDEIRLTRGDLNLGELSAIRTRMSAAHGWVFTVQL